MGDSEFSLEQSNIQHRGTQDGASVAIALFARCLFQRRTEEHNVTEIGYFALFWLFLFPQFRRLHRLWQHDATILRLLHLSVMPHGVNSYS